MNSLEKIPSPREIRAAVPSEARNPSWLSAFAVLVPSLLFYCVAWFGCAVLPWWTWFFFSPLVGLAVGILFVPGHDGAHHSFVGSRFANAWIARILFAPSWHNYTGWVHAHNFLHHGWTNFAPKDYVWRPLSLEQYRALSPMRQAVYRLYRWWPGFAFFYAKEILWDRIILLQPEVRKRKVRIVWMLDNLLLVAIFALQAWVTLAVAARFHNDAYPVALIFAALIIPASIATWLNAFLTYLQHTHAKIAWFQVADEWNFFHGQVLGTTHTHFPVGIGGMIHHIMEHAAHHVDPHIPLYHLPAAQKQLVSTFPSVRNIFTLRSFAHTQRVCRLYDYVNHCWLDYDGQPTSSRTIEEESLVLARNQRGHKPEATMATS